MVRDLKGKHPNYYEAILQLRDVSMDVLDYIDGTMKRIVVVKIVKVKNGYDYFLADNIQGRQLSQQLQSRFGGEILITSSLHTAKDSKELYRTSILFRESPFRKGDIVDYQGEEFKVRALTKDIYLQHTKTGKKVHVRYKDMKQIRSI
jgi:NMD protein affecting ribosome stability and mRNA decay